MQFGYRWCAQENNILVTGGLLRKTKYNKSWMFYTKQGLRFIYVYATSQWNNTIAKGVQTWNM